MVDMPNRPVIPPSHARFEQTLKMSDEFLAVKFKSNRSPMFSWSDKLIQPTAKPYSQFELNVVFVSIAPLFIISNAIIFYPRSGLSRYLLAVLGVINLCLSS